MRVLDAPEVKHDSGKPWQVRAIEACAVGERPALAAFLFSLMGKPAFSYEPDGSPLYYRTSDGRLRAGFGPTFAIRTDGHVLGWELLRDGETIQITDIGSTRQTCDNLNRVADVISATDDERAHMFALFRKAISVDYRAILDPDDPLSRIQRKLN